MMLAVAKCRLMAMLRSALARIHRAFFLSWKHREYGETTMHLDIILLVVLTALAVWTEVDKLWRRNAAIMGL